MSGDLRRTLAAVPAAVLGLLVLLGGLAGCGVVSQPDTKAWDEQVQTTLADAASEVATARLALRSAHDDRVWSPYALVLVTESEKAADKLESQLASLQPPTSRQQQAEDVLDLLASATSAVREAREAAVDKKYDDPALDSKLAKLHDALEQASKADPAR